MKLSVMENVRSTLGVGFADTDLSLFRRAAWMLFSLSARDRAGSGGPWASEVSSDAMVGSIAVASRITDIDVFIVVYSKQYAVAGRVPRDNRIGRPMIRWRWESSVLR